MINDQLMAMAAHRYCLGRRSYITGACTDWLRATWDQFDSNTRTVMVRDTVTALMDGAAGSEAIDVPKWKEFVIFAWERLTQRERLWVAEAVAYKQKPWPVSLSEDKIVAS